MRGPLLWSGMGLSGDSTCVSGPIASIDFVDAAHQRREQLDVARFVRLELARRACCACKHVGRQLDQRPSARLGGMLDLAGALKRPHAQEGVGYRTAAHQQTMIAQDEDILVPE